MIHSLIWFTLIASTLAAVPTFDGLVNKKVDRIIDISSQIASVTLKIVPENVGKELVKEYWLTVECAPNEKSLDSISHCHNISYMAASYTNADKVRRQLVINQMENLKGNSAWRIVFNDDCFIKPGETGKTIEVEIKLTGLLKAYPETILQSERQFVTFNGNHYFFSPYLTKTQTTKVKLPSQTTIEQYSKLKPTTQSDSQITYGPYENVAPFSISKLSVHYENNSPFLTVTSLKRSIEVSHWGGVVQFEDVIDVRHVGAMLKGAFSRYEYQREMTSGLSSVKSFRARLPATASDIYYRDEIGNISTSNVRKAMSFTLVELRPRFPLFGGWKTHYTIGYSVPASEYLSEDNKYVLRVPFIDHMFDNVVVDHAQVRVILPEGSKDVKVQFPYPIAREPDELHYTYLDTIGRPVIVLSKTNLVEQHIQDIEIEYTFNKIMMLREPLLIVLALFLMCLVIMTYVRLDFSLTNQVGKEGVQKVSALVDLLLKHHDRRASVYGQYDQALVKFKVS